MSDADEKYKTAKELVAAFAEIGVVVSYNHVRNLMLIAPGSLSGRFARFSELHAFWRALPPGSNVRELARATQVKIGKIRVL